MYLISGACTYLGSAFVKSLKDRNITTDIIVMDDAENLDTNWGYLKDCDFLACYQTPYEDAKEYPFEFSYLFDRHNTVEYLFHFEDFPSDTFSGLLNRSVARIKSLLQYFTEVKQVTRPPVVFYITPYQEGVNNKTFANRIMDEYLTRYMKLPKWYSLKTFNVFGKNEPEQGMSFPSVKANSLLNNPDKIHLIDTDGKPYAIDKGDPSQVIISGHNNQTIERDYTYVDDVVDILHHFVNEFPPKGFYDIGTGKLRSCYEITESLLRFLYRDKSDDINIVVEDSPLITKDSLIGTPANVDAIRGTGYKKKFTRLDYALNMIVKDLRKGTQ